MMTTDNAAWMRERYGETQGKTCGECAVCVYCRLVKWMFGGEPPSERDAACGKFEEVKKT